MLSSVDLLATLAAITGQELDSSQLADSTNMLPGFVGEPKKNLRNDLIISPYKPSHLTIRKGKWVYIGAQSNGGFVGKKPGSHTFAGPAAISHIGRINSDIEKGKLKRDAAPAQLYDLEADPNQTKNLFTQYPEVVKQLKAELAVHRSKVKAAPKRTAKNKKK